MALCRGSYSTIISINFLKFFEVTVENGFEIYIDKLSNEHAKQAFEEGDVEYNFKPDTVFSLKIGSGTYWFTSTSEDVFKKKIEL